MTAYDFVSFALGSAFGLALCCAVRSETRFDTAMSIVAAGLYLAAIIVHLGGLA